MSSFFDHTINGLIIGNIYALLAVGLALIFGVSNLINFAHGSVYMVGAYIGWICVSFLATPLLVTILVVSLGCALLGIVIERVGLRPLQGSARIAPLLATIGISFVLDQTVQLFFGADPRALPSQLPRWRIQIGTGTIGALDLLIAAVGIVSAGLLFGFLRFSRLGWAVRATAQDRDAALQMGVDVNAVNRAVRNALKKSQDRQAILDQAYFGEGDLGHDAHVAPVQPDFAPIEVPTYDPEGAKQLLEQAGVRTPLTVKISVGSGWTDVVAYAEALREQAKPAGFNIELDTMPNNAYWDTWTEVPLGVTPWTHRPLAVMLLPLAYIGDKDGKPVPWNETRWVDREFSELLFKSTC